MNDPADQKLNYAEGQSSINEILRTFLSKAVKKISLVASRMGESKIKVSQSQLRV